MTPKKKVVLFIVEGFNDQTALAVSLEKLLTSESVKFAITEGDITSDYFGKSIAAKVGDCIKKHCDEYKFKIGDFAEAVLLVDMDGAYIGAESIMQKDGCTAPFYDSSIIFHAKPELLRKTQVQKQINLNHLTALPRVCRTIPFSVYFFSCNLDHVICGNANLTQKEKSAAADEFQKRFHSDLAGFLNFFHDESISVCQTYEESWTYIKKDQNSLKRCSNLHIFLSPAAARTQRDFTEMQKK